jgi:hypothetical protein
MAKEVRPDTCLPLQITKLPNLILNITEGLSGQPVSAGSIQHGSQYRVSLVGNGTDGTTVRIHFCDDCARISLAGTLDT